MTGVEAGLEGGQRSPWLVAAFAAAALALLALIGIWATAPGVERDLADRAAAALAQAGINDATASVDGRTVTLNGPARDENARAAAVDAVEVFGVRNVIDAFGAPAAGQVTAGYVFGAAWNGATLTLTGYMPSLDEQESLVAHARDAFPGKKIVDQIRVAPNPPAENWSLAVTQAVRALKPLSNGILKIEGTSISLGGNAPSEAAKADAGMALAQIPEPFTALSDIDIADEVAAPVAVDAYRFGAAYDGAHIALSGSLPSNATREALKAALAKPGLTLDDKTTIDNTAPDGAFADVVTELLVAMTAHADSAILAIEGRTVTLDAVSASQAEAKALGAAIDRLPAAYGSTVTLAISGQGPPPQILSATDTPAAKCQAAASAALAETPVVFASASSDLPETADALVTKLGEIAATCPDAAFEIAGHTDASGNAAKNVQLSEDRAAALEAALIVKGVDAARLTAKGYGASRPVAANDNDANKARNRRIEVIVRP
jgi:OOP family OmpA-OmpF porin